MRVLMHICCGPCSIFPLQSLREQGYNDITGYFYNPNIHPYKEFTRRLDTLKEFAALRDLPLIVDDRYTLEEFLSAALQAPQGRCRMCYEVRLRQAAAYAKAEGYEAFTTSLLVSPYQKHDLIREVGEQVAAEFGVAFLYQDFRTGWSEGVQTSRDLELYRQPYCGCIFSEKERYLKPRKGK